MPISQKPSQDFTPIKEIRDGLVVLKDDSLRIVLMASSINFALKSDEEQQAIIYQFQNFLNGLDFTVQIYIQSRKLDIRPYLQTLENRVKEQDNDLIKLQTREYMQFIKNFTESNNIMTKRFFIIIPYTPVGFNIETSFLAKLGLKNQKQNPAETQKNTWQDQKIQLQQRADVVSGGLKRLGVKTQALNTRELIELYYKIFNPGEVDVPNTSNLNN